MYHIYHIPYTMNMYHTIPYGALYFCFLQNLGGLFCGLEHHLNSTTPRHSLELDYSLLLVVCYILHQWGYEGQRALGHGTGKKGEIKRIGRLTDLSLIDNGHS